MDKKKPENYFSLLDIERSDEWVKEAAEEVKKFIKDREHKFQTLTLSFFSKHNPRMLALFAGIPDLSGDTFNIQSLFYYMGYIKGLSVGEDKGMKKVQLAELEKMMGDD